MVLLALVTGVAGPAGTPAGAASGEVFTTVSSTVYNGYTRVKQSGGTFKPETYSFGEGQFSGGAMRDPSIDGFPFLKLARVLAPYLARQNYLPTRALDQTDLIIVVHWGTTIPYDQGVYRNAIDGLSMAMTTGMAAAQTFGTSPGALEGGGSPTGATGNALGAQLDGEIASALMLVEMEDRQRDQANARNAALLGYLPELNRLGELKSSFAGFGTRYQDLVVDLEEDRYFVILAAYDFHAAWKEKKLKLLWITRVSIRERGNRFDEQLAAMLASAAPYFGRDTPGLMRGFAPEGKVKIGEPKVVGVAPEPRK